MMIDVLGNGLLRVGNAWETSVLGAEVGNVAGKALDHVQSRCAGGCEVHDEERLLGPPGLDLGMLMGRVVVRDQVQQNWRKR